MPDDNEQQDAEKDADKQRDLRQAAYASSIGWMFPIAMGLGWVWGWAMDVYLFHTTWLRFLFLGFGIVAAFVNLFRIGLSRDE